MSEQHICPYSQTECRFDCSAAAEYCFQMRTACHSQIRKGHAQFGQIANFAEEPPNQKNLEQGDLNHRGKQSLLKAHAKLHNKVYFQGIDKRRLNPATEYNEQAAKNAEELQLRNALRYRQSPKPTLY